MALGPGPWARVRCRVRAATVPAGARRRRGATDLVAEEGSCCWLLDYKTTRRPQVEPPAEFEERLRRAYRPQLQAYREMLVRLRGVDPRSVKTGLYLTAEARWIEV